MLLNNRVIWSDNGVLKDLSIPLSDFLSLTATIDFKASEDALYIGSDMPFNHRWIEVSTANDVASTPTVSLWDANRVWTPVVDTVDQTAISGVTLAQSQIIAWTPDRFKSWMKEISTEDMTGSGLTSLKIYDLYWAKLTFSSDLKTTTALKYVGYRFSSDEDLLSEYPSFASTELMTAFKAGKTTWNDQHFIAAEYIIQDLRVERIVWSKNQIIDWAQFKSASVHKTAEIIFRSFGNDYKDEALASNIAYKSAMKVKSFNIDQNANATLDAAEKFSSVEYLSR